jgi:predicted transcriptional regulator of viral defense system
MPLGKRPSGFDRLYAAASQQGGYFTTRQAAEAGYSPQLLLHLIRGGRVERALRGVYRLVHFPPSENADLIIAWLWSGRVGVFSHQTALALHGLSDVLPARVHMTVPEKWRQRRVHPPKGVVLHVADVGPADTGWSDTVPVTTPARTLLDNAKAALSPELLRQALDEAYRRGLVPRLPGVEARVL